MKVGYARQVGRLYWERILIIDNDPLSIVLRTRGFDINKPIKVTDFKRISYRALDAYPGQIRRYTSDEDIFINNPEIFKTAIERRREAPEMVINTKDYPMRFGVELEYECENCVGFNKIFGKIALKGTDPYEVKPDGSLSSPGGFEVVSPVFDSLNETREFMDNVLEVAEEMGADNRSPTAIHIHVSNMSHPERLFPLMERFKKVFEHLRKKNKSGLVHSELLPTSKTEVEDAIRHAPCYGDYGEDELAYYKSKKLDPILSEMNKRLGRLYMNGRRTTLRHCGYDSNRRTLEFRVFPQRMDKNIHRIYCQIVEKLIEYANNHSLDEMFKPRQKLFMELQEFQKICELSNTDMYRLFHRKTRPSLNKIRGDMKYHEIVKLPEQLTPFKIIDGMMVFGDLYTFKVGEIVKEMVTLDLFKNGEFFEKHYLTMNQHRPTHDGTYLKKMLEEGIEATMNPDNVYGDLVFYIPDEFVVQDRVEMLEFINIFQGGVLRLKLTPDQHHSLEEKWTMTLTPDELGVNVNQRQWMNMTDSGQIRLENAQTDLISTTDRFVRLGD